MNILVSALGWMCLVALCIAAAALAIALAAHCYGKAMERFEWAVDAKTRHALGRSIAASAHWFSESQDTWLALKILGERIINQGGADSDQWREEWRKARAADKPEGKP